MKTNCSCTWRAIALFTAVLLSTFWTRPVSADSLGLTVKYPDISGQAIPTSYTLNPGGSTGVFKTFGTGLILGLDIDGIVGGNEYHIRQSTYDLNATLNSDGSLVGGTLQISGNLKTYNGSTLGPLIAGGTMLSGTLTEFGFVRNANKGGVFEFRFLVTGGYLRTSNLFPANSGEIIVSAATGTGASDFTGNFSLNNTHVDTFVPTPIALPAGASLLGVVCGWRCLSRRRRAA
jgi:hypothetical protein